MRLLDFDWWIDWLIVWFGTVYWRRCTSPSYGSLWIIDSPEEIVWLLNRSMNSGDLIARDCFSLLKLKNKLNKWPKSVMMCLKKHHAKSDPHKKNVFPHFSSSDFHESSTILGLIGWDCVCKNNEIFFFDCFWLFLLRAVWPLHHDPRICTWRLDVWIISYACVTVRVPVRWYVAFTGVSRQHLFYVLQRMLLCVCSIEWMLKNQWQITESAHASQISH